MLSPRVPCLIASAQLIGFFTTACSLALNLPETTDITSDLFSVSNLDDVEFITPSLSQLNASNVGGQSTNLTLPNPVSASDDLDYECSTDYGTPLPVACRFVYMDMPDFDRVITWGDRRNSIKSQVLLPVRNSDGKKSALL